jgi:hypothetical protein
MRLSGCALAALFFLLPGAVFSQFNSFIEGVVTDRSGAVVPAAAVTVTNVDTGVPRSATSSSERFYRVVDLGPGKYKVVVEDPGFRTSEQRDLALAGSQTVRVNATLDIGSVGETVTVAAEAPQVETEQGRISGNITTQDLQELPLNGRNLYNIVALTPGVSGRGLAATFGAAGGGNNNDSFAAENQPVQVRSPGNGRSNLYSYLLDTTLVSGIFGRTNSRIAAHSVPVSSGTGTVSYLASNAPRHVFILR